MLLPFFVLPVAADMSTQFDFPKLVACFLLGNIVLGAWLARAHPIFLLIHAGITVSTVVTGYGSPQLYFYAYWTAGAVFACWVADLDRGGLETILGFMVASGVVVAAHCYIQVFWHDPLLHYAPGINNHLPIAFLRQHTLLGAFLAPVACLALGMRRYKCFLFMLPILFLAHSYFTILALCAGCAVIALDRSWGLRFLLSLIPASVLGVVGVYLLRPQTFYSHGRLDVWQQTISWWWHHARWVGSGGGSFRVLFPPALDRSGNLISGTGIQDPALYQHGAFWQAHNDYIQALFEFGLLGFVIVLLPTLLTAITAFWRGFQWKDKPGFVLGCQAMLAGFMANALGNFPWQLAPHYLFALTALAVTVKYSSERSTISESH